MQTQPKKSQYLSHNLATVSECDDGRALTLNDNGIVLKVYQQASHVPPVALGDEVLYVQTEYGPYIIASSNPSHVIYMVEDAVRLQCGESVIQLHKQGEITVKNKKASIKVSATGDVKLHSESLIQSAEKNIYMTAKQHIHLNSD